ncbi:hypothetical protein LJC27_03285 [Christensenellaceae bacterium OttesenSCG-928-M15]|nr:hypothetical protein [Christensenellaceae bacterium OttesenSCG-928-M15]
MKRTHVRGVALLLICGLLFALAACQKPVEETNASPTPEQSPEPTPVIEAEPPVTVDPAAEPNNTIDAETEELLNGMNPVFDSVSRALMDLEEDSRYLDAQDPMIFWSVMYYFCANYGTNASPLVMETEDSRYVVPGDVMRQFASACFAEYDTFPEIPPQTFAIVYDEESDTYYIGGSDAGDTYVKKIRYSINEEGDTEALIGFFAYGEGDVESLLGVFRFVLGRSEAADAAEEPLFAFQVFAAHESYTDLAMVTNITEKDGVYYATLDFVKAVFHFSDDLDENGEEYGADFQEIVNEKEEAVDVRISENLRFEFHNIASIFDGLDMKLAAENPFRFFIENAAREASGQHLYFILNIYEGVLHGGELSDYHYAG